MIILRSIPTDPAPPHNITPGGSQCVPGTWFTFVVLHVRYRNAPLFKTWKFILFQILPRRRRHHTACVSYMFNAFASSTSARKCSTLFSNMYLLAHFFVRYCLRSSTLVPFVTLCRKSSVAFHAIDTLIVGLHVKYEADVHLLFLKKSLA